MLRMKRSAQVTVFFHPDAAAIANSLHGTTHVIASVPIPGEVTPGRSTVTSYRAESNEPLRLKRELLPFSLLAAADPTAAYVVDPRLDVAQQGGGGAPSFHWRATDLGLLVFSLLSLDTSMLYHKNDFNVAICSSGHNGHAASLN